MSTLQQHRGGNIEIAALAVAILSLIGTFIQIMQNRKPRKKGRHGK